jgi:hypothetical protein
MSKTVYTLCVDNYTPEITALTFPLMRAYAAKIGADFQVITERKYPEMPITFEKFQVAEKAKERGDEWALFFDADTLIDPEMYDPTAVKGVGKETVMHNGNDFSAIRWRQDKYMMRDGRNIGSCTWCVIASDWTYEDLWMKPDIPLEEILGNIFITVGEHNSGHCKTEHLIDDYLLSRNIARYGLAFKTIAQLNAEKGMHGPNGQNVSPWLWHLYTLPNDVKIRMMLAVLSTPREQPAFPERGQPMDTPQGPMLKTPDGRVIGACGRGWGLMSPQHADDFRKKWNIDQPVARRVGA